MPLAPCDEIRDRPDGSPDFLRAFERETAHDETQGAQNAEKRAVPRCSERRAGH